jgi:CubicO group peptidase (beta-lactamase class C family)
MPGKNQTHFALPAVALGLAVLWTGSAGQTPSQAGPLAEVRDPGHAPGAVLPAALPAWLDPIVLALERRLAADVAADAVGSLAAAVVIGDSVVWQAAFGHADRESERRAAPTTVYRAGSISKSITALTLLALVERGVVALDDPVDPHLPELRHLANRSPDAPPITFRQLASHRAGLAREPALSHAGRGPFADWRRRLMGAIPATEIVAPPGSAYLYSNVGFALLGLAMERAAGQPFEQLVRELVLGPLGMTSTWFQVPPAGRSRLATGYVNLHGGAIDPRVPRAEHRGRGYRPPSGGVYSTVGDLARLAMAMTGALEDTPVGAAIRAEALTPQDAGPDARDGPLGALPNRPRQPVRFGYGLGFQLHRIGATAVAGHSGTVPGYTAYMAFDPATRIGVVLLRNYNRGATNLGATAAALVLELATGIKEAGSIEPPPE